MNITPVQDDAKIWKKGANANPEVIELVKQIASWEVGKTFEVTFEKPFKTLAASMRHEFGTSKNIQVKKKDKTGTAWYVRIDPAPVKIIKSKKKSAKKSNEKSISTAATQA